MNIISIQNGKNLIIDNTKLQIDKNNIEKELAEHNNIYSDFDRLYTCYLIKNIYCLKQFF